jgi:formamidopyrimidine-DNA glycosylase
MPELPDVEGARRLVERAALGARVTTVVCPDPSALRNVALRRFRAAIVGATVRSAARWGKWLTIGTDGASVVVHLGMTGSLHWQAADGEIEGGETKEGETEDGRFCRLALVTERGALRFLDRRKLGGVWLAADDDELGQVLDDLGPDALGLPCDDLLAILSRSGKQLKAALMDQSLLAGLGNMLSDEILWRAHLHPSRVASSLDHAEGERLCAATRSVLAGSVRVGHIPRTRAWLSGQRAVDDPTCPRCGSDLRWSTVNSRSALWCPHCQPPTRRPRAARRAGTRPSSSR